MNMDYWYFYTLPLFSVGAIFYFEIVFYSKAKRWFTSESKKSRHLFVFLGLLFFYVSCGGLFFSWDFFPEKDELKRYEGRVSSFWYCVGCDSPKMELVLIMESGEEEVFIGSRYIKKRGNPNGLGFDENNVVTIDEYKGVTLGEHYGKNILVLSKGYFPQTIRYPGSKSLDFAYFEGEALIKEESYFLERETAEVMYRLILVMSFLSGISFFIAYRLKLIDEEGFA